MTKYTQLMATIAFSALAFASSAQAAGFFIQEQSSSAGGSAYSGAATNTKDASTIFFNPAGMTKLGGAQATLGVQVIKPSADLDNRGSTFLGSQTYLGSGNDGGDPFNPTPVPSGFAATPVPYVDGLWLGLGVSAPFGLELKYDQPSFARFDSTSTKLSTIDIQPTVAYQISNWLSVGGGLDFQRANATLKSAAFAGTQGDSELKGDDWGYGYTLGAQMEVLPDTTLGLNYRSKVHYDLDGHVKVTGAAGPGSLTFINAKASLVTPDVASFGLSHKLDSKWTVMGQANWMGWNSFDNITARSETSGATISRVEQNYQTVWSYALGAEYAYSPEWTFRAGTQYDNTPTTDEYRTTRTPDGDRTWLSAGTTYSFNNRMSLDVNASYIFVQDQEINVVRNGGLARVAADTSGDIGIVGAALNYKF